MLLKVFGKAMGKENHLEAWAEPVGRIPTLSRSATMGGVTWTDVSSLDFQEQSQSLW